MRLFVVTIDSFLCVVRALFAVIWAETVSRTAGPLALKALIQPLMVFALAVCHSIGIARSSRKPLLSGAIKCPATYQEQLLEGASVASLALFIAIGVGALYPYVVLTAFGPLQSLIMGILLACIPYVFGKGSQRTIFFPRM